MNIDAAAIEHLHENLPPEYKVKTITKERLAELNEIAQRGGLNREQLLELQEHAAATITLQERFDKCIPSRAEIAMHVLPVLIEKSPFGLVNPSACAQEAVQCADALLEELGKQNEKVAL